MIESVATGVILIWVLFLTMLFWLQPKKTNSPKEYNEAFISVLIALRNEEDNVQALCESLKKLNYPTSKIEFLFGDDDSDDATFEHLQRHKPKNASVFSFNQKNGFFGKQKVLSKLAKKAKGDFLLLTDADMQFHPDWIQGMLSSASLERDIVVGLTKVSGNSWFDSLQNIDWLFNEWIIGWFASKGIDLTAWGNNFMISKLAYDELGGYEGLEQTVVEDVALMRAALANGGRLVINYNSSAIATTKSVSLLRLLHQRKRWMKGLMGVNPFIILGGLIKWLFWPMLIFMVFQNSFWAIAGIIAIGLKWMAMLRINKVTKTRSSVFHLLLFEIYDFAFYLLTFAFYLLPIKLVWKGRKY